MPEKLTLALQILRDAADEQGNIPAREGGVTRLLEEGFASLGGTRWIAGDLRKHLKAYGLFTSKNLGPGRWNCRVDMSVREITNEWLAEYRKRARSSKEVELSPSPVGGLSQIDALADIVEAQATALATLADRHAACEQRITALLAQVEELQHENAALKQASHTTNVRAAKLVAQYAGTRP